MANLRLDWGDDAPVKDVDPTKAASARNPAGDPKGKGVMGPAGLAKAMINSANAKVGHAFATLTAQSSCPDGKNASYRCPLYNNGCYAEDPQGGKTIFTTKKLNEAAGLVSHNSTGSTATPLEVATDEAAAIEAAIPLWKKLRVNNWVRLHVVGDAVTAECARIISKAADLLAGASPVGTKNIWNYTHGWRQVPRNAWSSNISMLASCDTIEDLPKAHAKGYATAIVMPKQLMKAMGEQQNKDFGKSFELPNGFKAVPCPYEIGNIVKVKAKQCIECKLCMKESWLKSSRSVIVFAAHTSKSEAESKKLIDITIDDVSATDTGVPVSENPVRRKAAQRLVSSAYDSMRPPAREYSQPAYDETRPTSRDAYNAGLEAGAEDRHVPATKAEEIERVQSQAWQFLQGHRFGAGEGTKLATQFATGYREGMSGKYMATANPGGVRDLLARWESKGGKYWVEVYGDERGQTYRSDDGGGNLGNIGEDAAIEQVEKRVLRGDFLPDRAKTPMVMTYHKGSPVKYSGHSFDTTAKRLNPHLTDEAQEASSAAAAMYATFHGRDSGETLRYVEDERYEDNLAVLGEMVEIKLETLGKKAQALEISFDGCHVLLTANPAGTQLYLVGGDQSVDLKAVGLTGHQANKVDVALGIAVEITYRTQKAFDKFATIDYFHQTSEETKDQYPVITYDTVNKTMKIVGGSYRVAAEGICD